MQTTPEGLAALKRGRELLFKFVDEMTVASANSSGVAQALFHAIGQTAAGMAALLQAEHDRPEADADADSVLAAAVEFVDTICPPAQIERGAVCLCSHPVESHSDVGCGRCAACTRTAVEAREGRTAARVLGAKMATPLCPSCHQPTRVVGVSAENETQYGCRNSSCLWSADVAPSHPPACLCERCRVARDANGSEVRHAE